MFQQNSFVVRKETEETRERQGKHKRIIKEWHSNDSQQEKLSADYTQAPLYVVKEILKSRAINVV